MGRVFVIGGSSAYLLEKENFGRIIEVKRLDTPYGISNPIYKIEHPNGFIYHFLSRHGEKDYDTTAPFVNYRANIYAAKEIGAEIVVSWSGPGSLREDFKPGDFVVPTDVLDFTKSRKSTFFENGGLGFVRQSPLFCPNVRKALISVLSNLELPFHEIGVYVCTEGPRLETKAEIKMFKNLGADLVGMTLVPEVFLARELELCYGALCYVTNYAEGIKNYEFKGGVLFEGMLREEERKRVDLAVSQFPIIVLKVVEELQKSDRNCPCSRLMERYRRKGKIGNNWKDWLFKL
ncbi:methylthioadenosine phosphorylase [Balnearium lithotrophicum]|uniref:Probable 6-oxopurine nucleoside phosphorylase n=1 Tax=Balnearium lithotrophicum TaxID=223788 RepID=A0A521BQX1_9BACT|nr:MTAP family purine nucleoside phosphorylase [Balnearium lithotrophicum]SMO49513.1 methylthioadenosine phosphorylase [Balnearium lithotrophicum]